MDKNSSLDQRRQISDASLALSSVPAMIYKSAPEEHGELVAVEMLNDKAADLLGYDPDCFREDPFLLHQLMHPEDRIRYEATERDEVWHNDRAVLEHRFRHADGGIRWLRRYLTQIRDQSGNVIQCFGCAFDITDLKYAEQRLSNFLEGAPDAVVTVNEDGGIVRVNSQATRLFGYRESELVGNQVRMLLPEGSSHKCLDEISSYARTATTRAKTVGVELVGLHKDGTEIPLEVSLSPLEADGEQLVLCAARDTTERKKMEAQLQQAQKMEAVGQLTGGIAHDFNNLLTIVIGNLQLNDGLLPVDSDLRNSNQAALEAALRGAELTKRLLAFSRHQLLAPRVTDVNDLVAGIQSLIKRTLGADITLKTDLYGDPLCAHIDIGQLENSLINLAINARDAMTAGGTLFIETSRAVLDAAYAEQHAEVTPGEYVLVTVSDTGTGISREILPRIFDPFFSTKETGKGSGLGLSMVYGFVKQSRGHVRIYSEEGHGTAIKIYLPRVEQEPHSTAESTVTRRGIPNGDEVILLVEDDLAVRQVASALLTNLGYRVYEAGTGAEALVHIDQIEHVDLLFTDIMMPGGLTGLEVADYARKRFPDVRVLLTSGYTESAVSDTGLLRPGDSILNKPYRREALAQTVRDVLDRD